MNKKKLVYLCLAFISTSLLAMETPNLEPYIENAILNDNLEYFKTYTEEGKFALDVIENNNYKIFKQMKHEKKIRWDDEQQHYLFIASPDDENCTPVPVSSFLMAYDLTIRNHGKIVEHPNFIGNKPYVYCDLSNEVSKKHFDILQHEGHITWDEIQNKYIYSPFPLDKNKPTAEILTAKCLLEKLFIPLHKAAEFGAVKIINYLCGQKNIDPNIVEPKYNDTALHLALKAKSLKSIAALLQYDIRSSLTIKDYLNNTPNDYAANIPGAQELLAKYKNTKLE